MPDKSPLSNDGRTAKRGLTLSIGAKLWMGMVVVVGAAATLLFFELAARERESLVASKVRVAETVADLFASGVAAPLDFDDDDAIQAEMKRVRSNLEVDRVGVWVGDELRLRAADPVTPPWPAGRDGARVTDGRVEAVRPVIGRGGKRLGSVAVVFSLAAEDHAYEAARSRLSWFCAILALSTATVLFVFTRLSIVRPIERLARAVRRLEAGQQNVDLGRVGGDEVGRLTTAFVSMRQAVVDREARLGDLNGRLRALLDSMRQAILVFGPDRKLDAIHSRAAEEMFHRSAFEGEDVVSVIYGHAEGWMVEPSAFRDWCALAFQCGPGDWDDVADLAPQEIVFQDADGKTRALTLELRPVFVGEELERVMALVSDESEKRLLKEEAEEGARAVRVMRRLVATAEVFASYLERTRERVKRCLSLVSGAFEGPARDDVFRALHTIKGESHSLELDELARIAHDAEEVLSSLPADVKLDEAQRRVLHDGIAELDDALDRAERKFVELSPTGAAALRRTTVDRDLVDRLLTLTQAREDDVAEVARALASRPFGEYVVALAERLPQLAATLGKQAAIEQVGAAVPIPPKVGAGLSGVLVHLVRNSIAHGIERPDARVAAGKPEIGTIRLTCEAAPEGPRIVVEDDGAGFTPARDGSVDAARPEGGSVDAARPEDGSVDPPSSSGPARADRATKRHPDLLSGRGVGLAAARDMLRGIGYEMTVESEPSVGTRFLLAPSAAVEGRAVRRA
jgi:HPt (histidine-containing phosphotransfer) domain-containing protein/HAMP domain-containing protein